ncbi:nucleolar and coiled-body phosphoprotein 1-like [Impatiens glandulifera]|uniref:nucleolar and coiled-body phosphoprotein 1-like n=1 Tax=Impatiens glandulifera TaxID=253017 RepID=UPI001FB15C91|nr:nucleolar and coiled-body phosphoprotein 1-like [Impatiens glandulifera]
MPSTSYVENTNPKPISRLLALKPRQVLLAELNAKAALTMKPSTESRSVLIHSILCFLDSNAFSKTLKRFLSEAQIQDDSWKACSFNLEDIFSNHFQTCDTKSVLLEKEVQPEIKGAAAEEDVKKKKKKSDANAELDPIGKDNNLEMDEQKKKEKSKRRKNKSGLELQELEKESEQPGLSTVTEEKGKKKKNKVDKSSLEEGGKEVGKEEKEKSKDGKKIKKKGFEKDSIEGDKSKEEVISKEKSKKRKRSLSDENAETKNLQEGKISDPVIEVNSVNGDNGKSEKKKSIENGHVSENHLQDLSVSWQDNEEDNSDAGRSAKKQRIESAEPKSAANAFRRVKVEEVVFTDERLQDNSYWAKDGADIGYGAKAQEVLGQVRGRGFRHEKTKKKRGSYRGGQIDLDSHSVKFNYSDEE